MGESNFAEGYAIGRDSAGNNANGGFGFGGDWIWAFLIFALLGWGRGGFGGGNGGYSGGSYSGIGENYALITDVATLERKMDDIANGICDSTFALNNSVNTGFFGVQNALCQGFSGVNLGLTTQGYETRNAITDVGYALKDCCCQTQRAIDGVNYNMATNFGTLNNTLCLLGRDIIDNQNANYRALHEELVANKIEAKNDRIAELTLQLNKADLKASQTAQNAYLISALGPKYPQPAYVVQPPQQVTFPTDCCGNVAYANYNNSGCGCC